jgi:hypothetical protein
LLVGGGYVCLPLTGFKAHRPQTWTAGGLRLEPKRNTLVG